jgi:uncharacterized protein (DUF302 family)
MRCNVARVRCRSVAARLGGFCRWLKLFAVIDHSGEAKAIGLELQDTKVVIIGSPQAGTPVMQAAPLASVDLQLKVVRSDRRQARDAVRN